MLVIGLTGGTGSGKGLVGKLFFKYNIPVLDTDIVARNVCNTGSECLNELVSHFGNQILNKDKSLNRKFLASIAFSNKEKHIALNTITHKYIIQQVEKWLEQQEKDGASVSVIDAPLLFESGLNDICDIIISVICPKNIRIQRIMARDNISLEEAEKRISRQKADAFFEANSNYIITNDSTVDNLFLQVEAIYKSIKQNLENI